MSVLTKVEVKGWRGRLFLSCITLALIIGGASMLYPFLLMVSGAMRSNMDAAEMTLVPRYMVEHDDLVRKFLETKYNYNSIHMNRFRQSQDYNFASAAIDLDYSEAKVADFLRFLKAQPVPDHWQMLGGTKLYQGMRSEALEEVKLRARERFDDNLVAFIADLGAPVKDWWGVNQPLPDWEASRTPMKRNGLLESYIQVMHDRDPAESAFVNLSGYYLERMVYPVYGMGKFEAFREANGLKINSYAEFALSERVPSEATPEYRKTWLEFVFDSHLNASFVRSDATDADYQNYVQAHFKTVPNMKTYWYDSDYERFEDVRLPGDHEWVLESQRSVYVAFLESLPPESLRLVGPEISWRKYLKDQYGTLAAAGKAHNCTYTSWDACMLPQADMETDYVVKHTRELRKRYAVRNFRIVFKQLFVQGRSFANSLIYVALALAFSLTLQPLVAYSLSRFHPRGTWKIIFIFVATMAFPPMVGMIPQFLIIQKLGLLNTFFALIMPVTINGMLIFLLKGFFDSIPKDLYDAAVIDGASEFRIFWQITMAMSTPILAVVALQTFSGAWNAFLYPLIVCPDPDMHVVAVWLQQFQQDATGSAVFASIIIASLPSLLIFIFAQRTIMRGIAVPSEK